jgi:hypothetical protein
LEKGRCGREIIGENFDKKIKQVNETIKKKTWEENFGRDSRRKKKRGKKI